MRLLCSNYGLNMTASQSIVISMSMSLLRSGLFQSRFVSVWISVSKREVDLRLKCVRNYGNCPPT